jgi:hypothetical protein
MEATMLLTKCAILATALFAGAAVYVSLVEQPARMACPTLVGLTQWRPSYKRATVMQASLAVLGFVLAAAAWLWGAGVVWLVAGLVLGAVVPFTLLVMWPTNKLLEDTQLDASSDRARELLDRWGSLHAMRSALGMVALLMMLFAI